MEYRKRGMTDAELKEWMESQYITNDNGCWIWGHHIHSQGYGLIQYKQKNMKVHRLYWLLSGREIPDNLHILHGKDCSKACYNPDHLSVGNPIQNALDRHRDGTMRQAKLTKEQVLEIRSKVDKSHTELAKEYGMSRQQIDRIINGTRWTWI